MFLNRFHRRMIVLSAFCAIFLFSLTNFADDFKATYGLGYINKRLYRGADIWPDAFLQPILDLSYSFIAFELEGGPKLNFTYAINDQQSIDLDFTYFDDGKPFATLTSHKEDYRNQRPSAFDAGVTFTQKFMEFGKIKFHYEKNLDRYYGDFASVSVLLPVLPGTAILALVGLTDSESSRYAYGPDAHAGFTDYEISLVGDYQILPWGGHLITSLLFAKVDLNNTSAYIQGDDANSQIAILFNWDY